MISAAFNTLIYNPLYNGLIGLINLIPWVDVGVTIVIFTVLVKLVLFPLSQASVKAQAGMKEIEPDVKRIREQHKKDKQKQAEETMKLYREKGINPFSGILTLIIQLPIIFALYFIFLRGGLPDIQTDILYSFVSVPENVNVMFLGLIDIAARSLPLALLTGITQYLQIALVTPKTQPRAKNAGMKEDLMRNMQLQMKYVMPVIIFFVAYSISAAVSIYWTTSNIFMIGQELWVRRKKKQATSAAQLAPNKTAPEQQ